MQWAMNLSTLITLEATQLTGLSVVAGQSLESHTNPNPPGKNENTKQPWTASFWHPPTLTPDRFQATSSDKTHASTGSAGLSSQEETRLDIPDRKDSGTFVFLNESYIFPSRSSRRQEGEEGAFALYPNEFESEREPAQSTLPVSTEWRDPYDDICPSYGTREDSKDIEKTSPMLHGPLSPTVRADQLSKVVLPWAQLEHETSNTIPQTNQSMPMDEEISSPEVDIRAKPAWIRGTLTPPQREYGLRFSLMIYVLNQEFV